MIFGKDKGEFDFDSFRDDVANAADPLVKAVNGYEPNRKKRKYKSPTADLHDSASLFFQAAADTLDKRGGHADTAAAAEASGFNPGNTVKDLKLDKKAGQAGDAVKNTLDEAGKRGRVFWDWPPMPSATPRIRLRTPNSIRNSASWPTRPESK